MELAGAVVAITGASSGIGRETAMAFGREGARLSVCARRTDRLQALSDSLRAAGADCLVLQADVADEAQVRGFVEATVARFGRLDVLVNNAGYGVRGRVEDTPFEDFERVMRVNYLGSVYGCRAVVPIMRQQRRGVIINVSSIVGHRSLPGGAAYGATKAAQISLTESLRVELRGTGVFACSVHPIGTATEFAEVAARESSGRPGGPLGPQQSAATVAKAIVRCARRPRAEVYPYALARVVVWANALFPGLLDRVWERSARRAGRM